MASKTAVTVLYNRASEVAREMEVAMRNVARSGAGMIASDASGRAPRLTGLMAASFEVDDEGAVGFTVSNRQPYHKYVELGTFRQAAQPHLTPAALSAENQIEAEAARAARQVCA